MFKTVVFNFVMFSDFFLEYFANPIILIYEFDTLPEKITTKAPNINLINSHFLEVFSIVKKLENVEFGPIIT